MFHHFVNRDKHLATQGAISLDAFEKIIDRFIDNFNVLRAEEWVYKAENNKLTEGEVCVTFDDGLRCQADIALPVLKRKGLTAFWFVQSGILVGDVGVLEVFRRFRNEYFPSVVDFYRSFFSVAFTDGTSSKMELSISDGSLEVVSAGFITNYLWLCKFLFVVLSNY